MGWRRAAVLQGWPGLGRRLAAAVLRGWPGLGRRRAAAVLQGRPGLGRRLAAAVLRGWGGGGRRLSSGAGRGWGRAGPGWAGSFQGRLGWAGCFQGRLGSFQGRLGRLLPGQAGLVRAGCWAGCFPGSPIVALVDLKYSSIRASKGNKIFATKTCLLRKQIIHINKGLAHTPVDAPAGKKDTSSTGDRTKKMRTRENNVHRGDYTKCGYIIPP